MWHADDLPKERNRTEAYPVLRRYEVHGRFGVDGHVRRSAMTIGCAYFSGETPKYGDVVKNKHAVVGTRACYISRREDTHRAN
jgi:hypothetical protein